MVGDEDLVSGSEIEVGQDGRDGKDAVITEEHIRQIVAGLAVTISESPELQDALRGEDGEDGEDAVAPPPLAIDDIDFSMLAKRIQPHLDPIDVVRSNEDGKNVKSKPAYLGGKLKLFHDGK